MAKAKLWTLSRYTKRAFGYDYIGFPTYVNIAKDFFDAWARQHSGNVQPSPEDFHAWFVEREEAGLGTDAMDPSVQTFRGQACAEVEGVIRRELDRRRRRVLPTKIEGKTARALTLQEVEAEYRQRLADEEGGEGQ